MVRALSELGITVINSRPFDPYGKGKIERFIETALLQLPVWFRRYGVKSHRRRELSIGEIYKILQYGSDTSGDKNKSFNTLLAHYRESKFTPVEEDKTDIGKRKKQAAIIR